MVGIREGRVDVARMITAKVQDVSRRDNDQLNDHQSHCTQIAAGRNCHPAPPAMEAICRHKQ